MNLKISVIIPTFNRANTIIDSINSVINQTFKPYEIIVVDDGSTDNTPEIVKSYYPEVKLIKLKQNQGAQAARNVGIKYAKGDWIAFLDSDDIWFEYKLQRQVQILEKVNFSPFTVIHCNPIVKNQIWYLPNTEGDNQLVYKKLLCRPSTMFQCMLTSKIALYKINLLDEQVPSFQEWDTAIRLAKICNFYHIQEPLFEYKLSENSISKDLRKDFMGYDYIIYKFKEQILKYVPQCWTKHLMRQINFALKNGYYQYLPKYLNELKTFDRYSYYKIKYQNSTNSLEKAKNFTLLKTYALIKKISQL